MRVWMYEFIFNKQQKVKQTFRASKRNRSEKKRKRKDYTVTDKTYSTAAERWVWYVQHKIKWEENGMENRMMETNSENTRFMSYSSHSQRISVYLCVSVSVRLIFHIGRVKWLWKANIKINWMSHVARETTTTNGNRYSVAKLNRLKMSVVKFIWPKNRWQTHNRSRKKKKLRWTESIPVLCWLFFFRNVYSTHTISLLLYLSWIILRNSENCYAFCKLNASVNCHFTENEPANWDILSERNLLLLHVWFRAA